jgi:hypothetical protein
MRFRFPREWRPELVSCAPHKFLLPIESRLRRNWAQARARLATIDPPETRLIVLNAWSTPGRVSPSTVK